MFNTSLDTETTNAIVVLTGYIMFFGVGYFMIANGPKEPPKRELSNGPEEPLKRELSNGPEEPLKQKLFNDLFDEFFIWNIQAVGLCSKKRETPLRGYKIVTSIIEMIKTGNRPLVCLVEVNASVATRILAEVDGLGYSGAFQSKGEYAPPKTKEDPDGVLVLYPTEKNQGNSEFTVMSGIIVVDKTAGAPYIRITDRSGKFVVFTHLKSKSKCSRIRFDQLVGMGVLNTDGNISQNCAGVVGDLNESPGEGSLVIDAMRDHFPPKFFTGYSSNMKEPDVLKDGIYKNDPRLDNIGPYGFNLSTTDWAFMFGTSEISCSCDEKIPESADDWYAKYFSDHRPVKCVAVW